MSDSDKKRLTAMCREAVPQVKVFEASIANDRYELTFSSAAN